MAMQMQRAFNSRMMTRLVKYIVSEGSYDKNNDWVQGRVKKANVWGVLKTGNQFSQFDEGESRHSEDGGIRYSDYRTFYVTDKYPIAKGDKLGHKGVYYNVLQRSDESEFGFYKVILEKSEEWKP